MGLRYYYFIIIFYTRRNALKSNHLQQCRNKKNSGKPRNPFLKVSEIIEAIFYAVRKGSVQHRGCGGRIRKGEERGDGVHKL